MTEKKNNEIWERLFSDNGGRKNIKTFILILSFWRYFFLTKVISIMRGTFEIENRHFPLPRKVFLFFFYSFFYGHTIEGLI